VVELVILFGAMFKNSIKSQSLSIARAELVQVAMQARVGAKGAFHVGSAFAAKFTVLFETLMLVLQKNKSNILAP
jgi:hypothetical protein